jgi:hypothetical protein
MSWRAIAAALNVGVGTVRRASERKPLGSQRDLPAQKTPAGMRPQRPTRPVAKKGSLCNLTILRLTNAEEKPPSRQLDSPTIPPFLRCLKMNKRSLVESGTRLRRLSIKDINTGTENENSG